MMYKDNISLIVAPEYLLQGMFGGLALMGVPVALRAWELGYGWSWGLWT